MAANMSQFLLLAERDLNKVWFEEETAEPTEYTQVFEVGSFDGKLYRREAKMAGFPGLQEIAEGAPVTYGEAIAPVSRRYDFVTRGLAYVITRKLWENDEYAQVRQFERAMKRATDDDIEQFAFGILNNAATTTVSAGFDTLALASASHTRMDGGAVQSNTASTALSLASLKDSVTAVKKFKDDRGRPFRSAANKLLIPVDLEFTAEEILGSPDRPDTANRAVNALRKERLSWSSFKYLTSTTGWHLVGPKHDMKVLWRNKPMTKSDTDFATDNIHRKVVLDIGRGHGEWRDYYRGNA
jgi:hypothetical protein